MPKLKTASKVSPEKLRGMKLHKQIALGFKPKGPIASKNAVAKRK